MRAAQYRVANPEAPHPAVLEVLSTSMQEALARGWILVMLPSTFVSAAPQFGAAAYSLAAVLAWGTSDFLGGYATRRANPFLFTSIVNGGGLLLMITLAGVSRAPFPSVRDMTWVLAGGISGGGSLAIFYRALAAGRMGITAPVAAVVGAAIPTLFSMATG